MWVTVDERGVYCLSPIVMGVVETMLASKGLVVDHFNALVGSIRAGVTDITEDRKWNLRVMGCKKGCVGGSDCVRECTGRRCFWDNVCNRSWVHQVPQTGSLRGNSCCSEVTLDGVGEDRV